MVELQTQTRNLAGATLTIKDGSVTPKTLLVPIDEGNLRFTVSDPAAIVKNRDKLSHFTKLPEEPVPVQFTAKFTQWKGKSFTGAVPSVPDALRKKGNASGWTSSTLCGPYTSDLDYNIPNPCVGAPAGTDQAELLNFPDFHTDSCEYNESVEYSTIIVQGRALVTEPVSTRTGS